MRGWLQREWERFGRSYDPAVVETAAPSVTSAILGTMIAVFAATAYIPSLASITGFRMAWVSILLTVAGGIMTTVTYRSRFRGTWQKLSVLIDTSCYIAAVAWAAVSCNRETGYVFAGVLAVMLIGFQGPLYQFSLFVALAFLVPVGLVVALSDPDPVIALAVVIASVIGLLRTLFTTLQDPSSGAGALSSQAGSVYQLGGIVGAGGVGVVYRALDPRKQPVAIKCLHPIWLGDEQQRKRLLREAMIVNTIDHPGVVPIVDHGDIEHAGPFLVMELLAGKTLRAQVEAAGGRIPWVDVVQMAQTVLGVLQAAHEMGVVHCDVKPSNVFLCDDGRVKLLDFGIARPPALMLDTTLSVHVAGTPACMAPEQVFEPAKIDARSDLWGLGATMFWAITGEWPRALPEPIGSLIDAARMPARPIGSLVHDVPEEVCRAVDRALQADPAERWQSASEMLACLRAYSSETHRLGATRDEDAGRAGTG